MATSSVLCCRSLPPHQQTSGPNLWLQQSSDEQDVPLTIDDLTKCIRICETPDNSITSSSGIFTMSSPLILQHQHEKTPSWPMGSSTPPRQNGERGSSHYHSPGAQSEGGYSGMMMDNSQSNLSYAQSNGGAFDSGISLVSQSENPEQPDERLREEEPEEEERTWFGSSAGFLVTSTKNIGPLKTSTPSSNGRHCCSSASPSAGNRRVPILSPQTGKDMTQRYKRFLSHSELFSEPSMTATSGVGGVVTATPSSCIDKDHPCSPEYESDTLRRDAARHREASKKLFGRIGRTSSEKLASRPVSIHGASLGAKVPARRAPSTVSATSSSSGYTESGGSSASGSSVAASRMNSCGLYDSMEGVSNFSSPENWANHCGGGVVPKRRNLAVLSLEQMENNLPRMSQSFPDMKHELSHHEQVLSAKLLMLKRHNDTNGHVTTPEECCSKDGSDGPIYAVPIKEIGNTAKCENSEATRLGDCESRFGEDLIPSPREGASHSCGPASNVIYSNANTTVYPISSPQTPRSGDRYFGNNNMGPQPPPVPKKTVVHVYPMRSASPIKAAPPPPPPTKPEPPGIFEAKLSHYHSSRSPTPPPIPPKPELKRFGMGHITAPPIPPLKPRLPTPEASPRKHHLPLSSSCNNGISEILDLVDQSESGEKFNGQPQLSKAHSMGSVIAQSTLVSCPTTLSEFSCMTNGGSNTGSNYYLSGPFHPNLGSTSNNAKFLMETFSSTSLQKLGLTGESQNGVEGQSVLDPRELEMEKASLIDSLSRKLCVLEEEGKALAKELESNERLNADIITWLRGGAHEEGTCASRDEEDRNRDEQLNSQIARYERLLEESAKVLCLKLKLSGQSVRVAKAVKALPQEASPKEKHMLHERQRRLESQLADAELLNESLRVRQSAIETFLRERLTEAQFASYEYFIQEKERLLIDSNELEDKIRLGEEQIKALRRL